VTESEILEAVSAGELSQREAARRRSLAVDLFGGQIRYSRAGPPPLDLLGRHVLNPLTRPAAGDLLGTDVCSRCRARYSESVR
jgi:hypothetical protein